MSMVHENCVGFDLSKHDTDVTMDNRYYYFSVTDIARQEYKVVKVSPGAHWDPAMPGH